MTVINQFSLHGRTAVLTGAGGVLGSVIAGALADAGANVWVTDLALERAQAAADRISAAGGVAQAMALDVIQRPALEAARDQIGPIDILVNAAGGNMPDATTSAERSFFDIPLAAMEKVIALNLFGGALLPSQVFGQTMAASDGGGVILNVSSMNALRPLTRIPGYSAAKAAVSNFTQWLAVHMAQEYNPRLRVNALAPGFFLTEQNRFLLTDEKTGQLTPRGESIIHHTPMARFGDPADLAGATVWLCSDAAAFVTGVVLPIDGGFSAFSGV